LGAAAIDPTLQDRGRESQRDQHGRSGDRGLCTHDCQRYWSAIQARSGESAGCHV